MSGVVWLCILCALGLTACGEEAQPTAPPRPVPLARVEASGPEQVRELLGRVEQTTVAPLAFEVGGRVLSIPVLDGAEVSAGAVIARLDAEPYRLQVERAQAQLMQLEPDLERKALLLADGIISQAQYDELASQTEMARVQLAQARRELRKTTLNAPFRGRIAQREVQEQQVVQAGEPAFYLQDDRRVDISVGLPSTLAQRLPLDQRLSARARLVPDSGVELELRYREHQSSAGRDEGVYRLVMSGARPPDVSLYPGMAARVHLRVPVAQAEARFRVPVGALLKDDAGGHAVWRYDADTGQVHRIEVGVVALLAEDAIVSGELVAGDAIVKSGVRYLREGQAVREWIRD